MALSIAHRQYLAFLTLTLLILATVLGLSQWNFRDGFLRFVQEQEVNRLGVIAEQVQSIYSENGDTWLNVDRRRLERLLGPGHRRLGPRRPQSRPGPKGRFAPDARPGPPGPPRGPGSSERRGKLRHSPTGLYGLDGKLLAGAPGLDSADTAVIYPLRSQGSLIGELRALPKSQYLTPEEERFSTEQTRRMWLIGMGCLILAVAFAALLSRTLLNPIKRLVVAIGQLSSGDYSVRLAQPSGDELGNLMQNLNRLATTLEEGQSARRRWLADVSHELRTPITALTGEIEALKDGVRTFDGARLAALDAQASRMRLFVDDLYQLSISDIGGFRYQFRDTDLSAAVTHAANLADPQLRDAGLTLTTAIADAVHIEADPDRLDQLLQNLLANSMRYTDAPGSVHISVSKQNDMALLTIEDSAPGPNHEECEQLFEPLYRPDQSRNRVSGGAGLGLAICQNIALAHGGAIEAQPSSAGGLLVQVLMPLRAQVEQ